ncbi:hypothetical protein AB0N31_07990 [Streptomyces sp. NPDC051051]|uniref:hypothetical protein n=1 Tax=Streptomyces sp. NPDC051051 TaxID=3155666 RepID=UPI0034176631
MRLMLNGVQGRLTRKRREAADKEIEKLKASTERLSLDRAVPPRVRLALRVYERFQRKGHLISFLYGAVVGLWWPMPIIFILDTRPGSMRDVAGTLITSATDTVKHAKDPADLVSSLLQIAASSLFIAAFYAAVTVGPVILGARVALGFAGVPSPGRKTVLTYRRSFLVYCCSDVLVACAEALNKSGERRIKALQKVGEELTYVRIGLRTAHRFTKGLSKRGRRKYVKTHALRVSTYLAQFEESVEEMTDSDLKQFAQTILRIAERCADGKFGNILEEDEIAEIAVPERESARLLLTAVAAIATTAASLYLIAALKLPSSLEPIAVSGSILLTVSASYGKRAVHKIDAIRGMTGQ